MTFQKIFNDVDLLSQKNKACKVNCTLKEIEEIIINNNDENIDFIIYNDENIEIEIF